MATLKSALFMARRQLRHLDAIRNGKRLLPGENWRRNVGNINPADVDGKQQLRGSIRPEARMDTYIILRNANRNAAMANDGNSDFPQPDWQAQITTADDAPEPQIDIATLDDKQINEIREDPATINTAPAMDISLIAAVTPAAPGAATAWGLAAVEARRGYDGDGVSIAVLDTGIHVDHPAFAGVTLDTKDFSNLGINDVNGHGTHCAGTIFGRDVDGVAIGVAPGVKQAFIGKILDDNGRGTSNMAFEGLRWAIDKKADVISMSMGFDFPGTVAKRVAKQWPVELATSHALVAYAANLSMFNAIMDMLRARARFDQGSVVVAAAGNESRRNAYKIGASLPAASFGVISVAALAQAAGGKYAVADFSNILATVSAPGVAITSAKAGGGLAQLSGTSMACPHVAGAATLWWQAMRKQNGGQSTAQEVAAKLLASARKDVFVGGLNAADHGLGLVTCPLSEA